MEKQQKKRIIEALIFAIDQPLSLEKIQSVVKEVSEQDMSEIVEELNLSYKPHAFEIRFVSGGYRMFTKPEYSKWVEAMYSENRYSRLTQQALETLAIVAYKQPTTRAEINAIRGVDSTGTLQGLIDKNLVRVTGRAELPGRPMIYGTTEVFLELFGLASLEDLPEIRELEEILSSEEDDHHRRLKLGTLLFEKRGEEAKNS